MLRDLNGIIQFKLKSYAIFKSSNLCPQELYKYKPLEETNLSNNANKYLPFERL